MCVRFYAILIVLLAVVDLDHFTLYKGFWHCKGFLGFVGLDVDDAFVVEISVGVGHVNLVELVVAVDKNVVVSLAVVLVHI